MKASDTPTPGSRFLVVRGAQTALRLALPAFGNLTVGSGAQADVVVDEPNLGAVAVELFLDFDVGVRVVGQGAQLMRFDPAGHGASETIAADQTVDLAPGDVVRLESLELGFAPAILGRAGPQPHASEVGRHHVWSRAYLETRLQELLWEGKGPGVNLLRIRVSGLERAHTEKVLVEVLDAGDLVGELGPSEHAVILPGTEARARATAKELSRALGEAGAEVRLGLVSAGEDDEPALLLEQASLRMEATGTLGATEIYTPRAPSMEPVMRLVSQVSQSAAPVLVLGETGTGKDVLAQLVHEASDRATGPFVRVNCIDLPETFLEDPSTNFLAKAAGGTVLLDQVGGLTERAQVSLGYLLEESSAAEHDVRFIATSNQDLAGAVERGEFRKDLYFRLNRVTLAVPPLRERVADIVPLAEHFVAEVCRESGRRQVPKLTRAASAQLEAYGWPGNLRELRNIAERAVLTCAGDTISVEQLPPEIAGQVPAPAAPRAETMPGASSKPTNLRDEIAALEKRRILEALEAYPTQTEAAKALGIPLRTFLNRLDALGIPRARKPAKG